jgi:hypothetical protein
MTCNQLWAENEMTTSAAAARCITQLLERVPELRAVYDEHVHDYDELLPHVFLGDVTRYVVQQVRSGETTLSTERIRRILESVEQYLASGDEEVEELVWVSFAENLSEYDDVLTCLRGMIGPNLANALRNYGK